MFYQMVMPVVLPASNAPIDTIEMHTTGEPTRIIYQGYPEFPGVLSLLECRDYAQKHYDHIRRRLMLEPRGHEGMYGALIVRSTELTLFGHADVGVLFLTSSGYSTMCGHATIALGRAFIDHQGLIMGREEDLNVQQDVFGQSFAMIKLHTPCGLIHIKSPVKPRAVTVGDGRDGWISDSSRPVAFQSVPSFVSAFGLEIPGKEEYDDDDHHYDGALCSRFTIDIAYGGAFFGILPIEKPAFPADFNLNSSDFHEMMSMAKQFKDWITEEGDIEQPTQHPTDPALSGLYSLLVRTQVTKGRSSPDIAGQETGLCLFGSDNQWDRSPTGSGVAARVALAYFKGERRIGERWAYHSLLSRKYGDKGAFIGTPVEEVNFPGVGKAVIVEIEGHAYYTGNATFLLEDDDPIDTGGFVLSDLWERIM